MRFLRISNPGLANPTALTTLGVSTSRTSSVAGLIGMFGSGTKHAISVCLRNHLEPFIMIGNLRMNFFCEVEEVDGTVFHRVMCRFQGKDPATGKSRNKTERMGWMVEFGELDWDRDMNMACREFVSNAIDGCLKSTDSVEDVQIDVVDMNQVRASRDRTTVYVPYVDSVIEFHNTLQDRFLHFSGYDQSEEIIPKRKNDGKVRIYKKGVLVHMVEGNSAFDYNLKNLKLDESRNASEWDVRYQCSHVLGRAKKEYLVDFLKLAVQSADLWELGLDSDYLSSRYVDQSVKEERGKAWREAFAEIYGPNVVAVNRNGSPHVSSFVQNKGYNCVSFPEIVHNALFQYGAPTDLKILTSTEREGRVVCDANAEQVNTHNRIWEFLDLVGMTNGKDKPDILAFQQIMDGGTQCNGEYRDGKCYVHKELGGDILGKVALEEMVHHITGAGDMSRDIQDYCFRLIVQLMKMI